MIYSLQGELTHWEAGLAVIECAGVGYACRTTMNTLSKIRDLGKVKLFTYLHVTENSLDLFGFADSAELASFKLALCIATGDSKTLTRSPGIGAKIAQRIVLELKDKVAKEQKFTSAELASLPVQGSSNIAEAITALQTLGFNPAQCGAALSGADPNASVEELIKFGLKNLG